MLRDKRKRDVEMLRKLEIIKDNIEYFVGFQGHNKNLTRTQFNKLEQALELVKEFSTVAKILEVIYLEYTNEYLTVDKMAEVEDINVEILKALINIGKEINNK